MSTMVAPVNPMAPEGKPVVLDVVRSQRQRFFALIDEPANWEVQTRCTEWQVRDLVGHMIDVTEGYLSRWEIAKRGESADALGLQVMGQTLDDHAKDFRRLSRQEAISRLKEKSDTMLAIFEALTPEEWSGFLVTHPYMGPVPAGFYPAFQIMDYGIHPYDIEYGLGNKLATIDDTAAGVLIPYCHIIMQYTVDQEAARGVDTVYGLSVSGPWGGRWRVTVKDGQWSAQPESGDFEGCQALFEHSPADFVLSVFGRFPGGSASGDPEVIAQVRRLFFRF